MAKKIELFVALWITYVFSVCLIVADLFLMHIFDVNLFNFYLLTNAALIYRLGGANWFTTILHAYVQVYVMLTIFYKNYENLSSKFIIILWLPLVVQILLAVPLTLWKVGRSNEKRACLLGVHAHMGLIVIIFLYWTIGFSVKRPFYCGIITLIYMLIFLIILLTPHFHGLSKAMLDQNVTGEYNENIMKIFGAVHPGHRKVQPAE